MWLKQNPTLTLDRLPAKSYEVKFETSCTILYYAKVILMTFLELWQVLSKQQKCIEVVIFLINFCSVVP